VTDLLIRVAVFPLLTAIVVFRSVFGGREEYDEVGEREAHDGLLDTARQWWTAPYGGPLPPPETGAKP
jgi:hypothetical protein